MPSFGPESALIARLLVAPAQHHRDISVAVLVPGQIAGNESLYGGWGNHDGNMHQGGRPCKAQGMSGFARALRPNRLKLRTIYGRLR